MVSKGIKVFLCTVRIKKEVEVVRCKICGEPLEPSNPPKAPIKFTYPDGTVEEYDLNEKRKPDGVEKVVSSCPNGHPQIVTYDWDKGKYQEKA